MLKLLALLGPKLDQFFKWLASVVEDSKTGLPSTKRVGFMMAISILCLILAVFAGVMAGLTMKSAGTPQALEMFRMLSTSLELISGMVLTAVTGGYIAGKHIERKHAKGDDDKDDPTPIS